MPSHGNEKAIRQCFAFYHSALIPLSSCRKFNSGDEDAGESYEKALPVKELFEKITVEDKRILPLCMYALISGNLEYDVELDDPTKRSKIWGSYIASDLFMRNSSPQFERAEAILLITNYFERASITSAQLLFSEMRLMFGRDVTARRRAK
eukprot:scaffold512739_cov236-Attheya_sp.AAC.1